LQQTGMGVTAVAVACGFSSASYFSRSYRAHFDISPKEDRVEAPAVRPKKPHKVSV
jgi:AraC family carnitine catabolism transcriptional activator